jgi:AcrR family transcriptional regulator
MTGVRARVRAELTAEIKRLARVQMDEQGPANLNLRAIARELGMVSSAIYRYFGSRDELLTALIVDAYNELGEVAEQADAAVVDRTDVEARFVAVAAAAYGWARANPSQYLLLFGTPVPGYAAPQDTIAPATRFQTVLLHVLDEAARQGAVPAVVPDVPRSVATDLDTIRALTGSRVDDALLLAGLQTWTGLFGTISFVLNGQFRNVIGDVDALVAATSQLLARQIVPDARRAGTTASSPSVEGA